MWCFSVVSRRNYKRNPHEKLFPESGNAEIKVVTLMYLSEKEMIIHGALVSTQLLLKSLNAKCH